MISLSDRLPHADTLTFPDDYEWSDELGAWVEKEDPTKEAEWAVILYYYLQQRRQLEQEVQAATEKVIGEDTTPEQWQDQMMGKLKPFYALVGWMALGQQPSESGMKAINNEYRFHQEKLEGFLADLGNLSEGQILRRSEMYPEATLSMLHKLRHEAKVEAGFRFSQRFLGEAEHCEDCVRYEKMGKRPIGVLPPPGTKSQCMFYCKCRIVYFKE